MGSDAMTRPRKNGTYPLSRRAWERIQLMGQQKQEIAAHCGFHASTLSLILHGRRGLNPRDPRARTLAHLLGLTIGQLLEKGGR